MAEPRTTNELALIASRYQTINTVVSLAAGVLTEILAADPRRWFVRFSTSAIAGMQYPPTPGPAVTLPLANFNLSGVQEYKFRDAPSAVTGEWYAQSPAGDTVLITEVVYLGD